MGRPASPVVERRPARQGTSSGAPPWAGLQRRRGLLPHPSRHLAPLSSPARKVIAAHVQPTGLCEGESYSRRMRSINMLSRYRMDEFSRSKCVPPPERRTLCPAMPVILYTTLPSQSDRRCTPVVALPFAVALRTPPITAPGAWPSLAIISLHHDRHSLHVCIAAHLRCLCTPSPVRRLFLQDQEPEEGLQCAVGIGHRRQQW